MNSVAIITPSNYCSIQEITQAKKNLKNLGFAKILDFTSKKRFFNRWAGTPKERLNLFQKALHSKTKVVFACRGGSGICHFISQLNFKEIKKTKKVFVGYSDLTPLLNKIHQETGLISLHGPMPIKDLDNKSIKALKDALQMKNYGIKFTQNQILNKSSSKTIKGITTGGNLERIRDSINPLFKINFQNKIIFLEEVDKSEQGIFNILLFLKQSKQFKPKALLIGDLNIKNKPLIKKILKYLFPNIPIITDLPFGHKLPNITIPIGVNTKIDLKKGTISFLF